MLETRPLGMAIEEQGALRAKLLGSPLHFTRVYYKLRTGRDFLISEPIGREPHIITIYKHLVKVFIGEIQFLNINIPPRYGKAIDVSTKILTRQGWKWAREIVVGDELVGSGGWTKVTGVYHQGILPAYEVRFSDNQKIICNEDHLWSVKDRYTDKWKTLKTSQIESSIYETDFRKHWRIPLIDGNYGEVKPQIDPYLLGCWLGGGHNKTATITTSHSEIIKSFEKKGYVITPHIHQPLDKEITYDINDFDKDLLLIGQLGSKHFPNDAYLWSKEDRLALLQGIMDIKGKCNSSGQASFTHKDLYLIEGVCYLVNSLGGKFIKHELESSKFSETYYLINIRLPIDTIVFRLEEIQKKIAKGFRCVPTRFFSKIKKVEPREMVCFSVDAKDKLFSIGKGLILTHNTEAIIHFIAWALGRYPDSNFIYVSYSHSLAAKQTQTIRLLSQMPEYQKIIGTYVNPDISAKDNFETTKGGSVFAAGAMGPITGRGAGIKGFDSRFGGAVIIDDIHKPVEVTSDTMRESVIDWYSNTLISRLNNPSKTPIIFIGQRLHEDDLAAHLMTKPGWVNLVLPALDAAGNALDPSMHTADQLRKMQEESPYEFAAQYQQNPQPAGGGVFKPEWFTVYDREPPLAMTFITVDTAETDKTYNDATVFSFWGLHKILQFGKESNIWGLYWIDCVELFIEPKDLEHNFVQFASECFSHKMPPSVVGIETKSTGTTLSSMIKSYPGLRVIDFKPSKKTGSLINGFLDIQSYVGRKLISLPQYGKHTRQCIEHCRKITANDTHRRDDIAVTMYYAIKMGLIDKSLISMIDNTKYEDDALKYFANYNSRLENLRKNTTW